MAWMSVANEILIIGSDRPLNIDLKRLEQRMQNPVVRDAMAKIEIPDALSLLGNLWLLEEEMQALADGHPIITDNRPHIEFYLDLGEAIGIGGRERYVFNRTPFADLTARIASLDETSRKRLKDQYRMMDLYQRGVMYGNRGQLLEAMALAPEGGLIRYHLQAGRTQVAHLVEEVEADPENIDALMNLGHTYYQVGDHAKSLEIFDRVLAGNPDHSFAHLYKAQSLLEMGRGADAKEHFETVAKKDPRQIRAAMRDIGLIELLKKLDENPENQGLLVSTAQYYNMKKEYLKALDHSLRALEKDPLNVQTLQSIVFSYRGLGEAGEVLDYASRYRMVDKEDIHLEFILGEIHAKTLNCEKAIPFLENVLKKNDRYPNARKLLRGCQREEATPKA